MDSLTKNKYIKLFSNPELLKCNVSEEDYKEVMPRVEQISRLAKIEGAIYAIYDFNKANYLLQSEEQKKIFGVNQNNPEIDLEAHYSRIHHDDRDFVLETDYMFHNFFMTLSAQEKFNYKLVYDFRTKTEDGYYLRFMHQSVVFEQDKHGNLWLNLVISYPLPEIKKNEKPSRYLINIETKSFHLFNDNENSSFNAVLTPREIEIVVLLARGFDSYNIADKLKISINTVNNHRQNILSKTQSDNTTQAVLFCKSLGLI